MSNSVTSPDVTNIDIADICGLWEVIRICDGNNKVQYPWLGDRFKFNFLEEMMILCIKDGQHFHGTWELSEKVFETKKRFSIILSGTFEYRIVDIKEDEIILSDHLCEYSLIRRLRKGLPTLKCNVMVKRKSQTDHDHMVRTIAETLISVSIPKMSTSMK